MSMYQCTFMLLVGRYTLGFTDLNFSRHKGFPMFGSNIRLQGIHRRMSSAVLETDYAK